MKKFDPLTAIRIANELGIVQGEIEIGVVRVIDDIAPFFVVAIVDGKKKAFNPAILSCSLYGVALDLAWA